MEKNKVQSWVDIEEERLKRMLETDDWVLNFQGKLIFSKICSDVLKGDSLRIKQAYVDIALTQKSGALQDLVGMFEEIR